MISFESVEMISGTYRRPNKRGGYPTPRARVHTDKSTGTDGHAQQTTNHNTHAHAHTYTHTDLSTSAALTAAVTWDPDKVSRMSSITSRLLLLAGLMCVGVPDERTLLLPPPPREGDGPEGGPPAEGRGASSAALDSSAD